MSYKKPLPSAYDLACKIDPRVEYAEFHDIDDTQYYIIYYPKKTLVVFRGTSTFGDAADDAKAYLVKFDCFDVKVHKGFYEQLQSAWPILKDKLSSFPSSHELHFVGHSLGGALATLAGFLAVNSLKFSNVNVTTFGSPKVGESKFVKQFNESVTSCKRYVNRNDIVTYAPWLWFKHVHGEINLGTKRTDWKSYYFGKIEDHSLENYEKNFDFEKQLIDLVI